MSIPGAERVVPLLPVPLLLSCRRAWFPPNLASDHGFGTRGPSVNPIAHNFSVGDRPITGALTEPFQGSHIRIGGMARLFLAHTL